MTEYSDEDARRIADRGRDALLERLRPAFHETARQHADVLQLEDAQIEEMIERAADRADGLQWRRALAWVATEELGMSLGEALAAPVVARAQELAGAPSYEAALAALGLEPVRSGSVHGGVQAAGGSGTEGAAEPEPGSQSAPAPAPAPVPETLRLAATHLGGIATLEAGEQDLELRIGAQGLDIARDQHKVLGRLRWREIHTLEVEPARGLRRRRRRQDRAQLSIRTQHGDATFEVSQVSDEELQAKLEPLLERYARR